MLVVSLFILSARKSNLVPDSMNKLQSATCLLRKHVSRLDDNLLVSFSWTKTIQSGERVIRRSLLKSSTVLCPVTAYEKKKMISQISVSEDAPLFSLSPSEFVTYPRFQQKLPTCLEQVVEDTKTFGTHSF